MAVKKTKVVDKWKTKKWYQVIAPQLFESKELCEVVAAEDSALVNRIISIPLIELLGNSSQTAMFTALKFRITDVNGTRANTKVIGHEVAPSFLKTFARRGKTLLHTVVDIKTKDNEEMRLKVVAITAGKISETTKKNLRSAIVEEIKKNTAEMDFNTIVQEVLYGRLVAKLFSRLKQIATMRRVEIRKSERKEVFK